MGPDYINLDYKHAENQSDFLFFEGDVFKVLNLRKAVINFLFWGKPKEWRGLEYDMVGRTKENKFENPYVTKIMNIQKTNKSCSDSLFTFIELNKLFLKVKNTSLNVINVKTGIFSCNYK